MAEKLYMAVLAKAIYVSSSLKGAALEREIREKLVDDIEGDGLDDDKVMVREIAAPEPIVEPWNEGSIVPGDEDEDEETTLGDRMAALAAKASKPKTLRGKSKAIVVAAAKGK